MSREQNPSKEDLRQRFRAFRKSLSALEVSSLSGHIVQRLLTLLPGDKSLVVLGYLPAHSSNEVDISSFLQTAEARGHQLALPVVTHYSLRKDVRQERAAGLSRIQLRHFRQDSPMSSSRWGIDEPLEGTVILPEAIDLAIIPALAADRTGYRLGNGFAYYDELIQQLHCPLVCPVYEGCVIDSVPHDEYDQSVDYLATENEIIEADTAL